MIKQEVMDEYIALVQRNNEVPTLFEFIQNTCVEPQDVAEIWRFDYEAIEDEIKAIVDKYELRVDVDINDTLVPGYDTVELDRPYGISNTMNMLSIYVNNRRLYQAICQEMNETEDIDRYTCLEEAKNLLFTSATVKDTFEMSDGNTAPTYLKMLGDIEPRLANKIVGTDDEDDLNGIIIYTLERLEDLFHSNELEYLFLNTPTLFGSLLSKYLETAFNVFKACCVQFRSMNVILTAGETCPIRVIDMDATHRWHPYDDVVHTQEEVAIHRKLILEDWVFTGDKVYTNL